jgi:hypothetical protein
MQKTVRKPTKKAKRSQARGWSLPSIVFSTLTTGLGPSSEKLVLDTTTTYKVQSAMDRDQYVNEVRHISLFTCCCAYPRYTSSLSSGVSHKESRCHLNIIINVCLNFVLPRSMSLT